MCIFYVLQYFFSVNAKKWIVCLKGANEHIRVLICSVKLLCKRVCADFYCYIQCTKAIFSIFKKIMYIQYRTKNFMCIMKTYTEPFLVERVKTFQTQETIAEDAFLGPQSGMEK